MGPDGAKLTRRKSQKKNKKQITKPLSDSEEETQTVARRAETADEDADGDVDMGGKDGQELELEKLVFGDSIGFREGLQDFGLSEEEVEAGKDEDEEQDGEGLGERADADIFFYDSGPEDAARKPTTVSKRDALVDDEGDVPAWEDSDDERITISLASEPRLRKLRTTAAEDVVTGQDYTERLRLQFERLNPKPEWAIQASQKRRRESRAPDSDDDSSDEDVDGEGNELSAQPLAKLLKNSDALSRGIDGRPRKKRKLQPEVLNIQQMKDIAGEQPSAVTSLSIHSTLPLMLSSGPASTVWLHHIHPYPPNPNPLLTSLHVKKTPLACSAFHPDPNDSRIFLGARRPFFHIWNLTSGQIERISRVQGHKDEQRSMEDFSISPNGKYVALKGTIRKGGGVVNILDATTLQWVAQARIEGHGGLADYAWWANGLGLSIVGKNGEVSEWSVLQERTIARWQDEGAVNITQIALGGKTEDASLGGDRWIAIGSASGIVNVYDRRAWLADRRAIKGRRRTVSSEEESDSDDSSVDPTTENAGIPPRPTPTKTLDQLVTAISHLAFSPDGQIMAMASRWKPDALRLVHLPSCTVFRNWPTNKTPLGRISSVAWGSADILEGEESKAGALAVLAVGNERGKIRMWEVRA